MPKSHKRNSKIERERIIEMGRRIESTREKLGLLKKDFAKKIGVSAATYTGWIKGRHSMTSENLARLVALTGEPSSFFTPDLIPRKNSIMRLSLELGAIIGRARLETLLAIPKATLINTLDAAIGTHVVAEHSRKPARN